MPPRYRIPRRLMVSATLDLLRGSRRLFSRDARLCVGSVHPPLAYDGCENIPSHPCVITINHYSRPGFTAWWLALGVSAAIPAEVGWLVTAAWTFPGRPWARWGEAASRRILARLTRMYGFISMPPMPPRPEELQARAKAVRGLLESARLGRSGWIGMAPEGRDGPGGVLQPPPSGSGRLLLLLAGLGLPCLPAGLFEQDDVCHVRFGPTYRLAVPADLSSRERDVQASRMVMTHLATLLPERLRGPYSELA
jgi:hypothetical protein